MIIQAATKADQAVILELEQTILDDMALAIYDELPVADVQEALSLAVAASDKSRYHYSRVLVAKNEANQILGVAFGYVDTEEKSLDDALQTVLADQFSYHRWLFEDSEVFDNEWYLDSIVVTDEARGQGIGKKLFQAVETRAKEQHRDVIGLNVDDGNPRAYKLYDSLGFKPVGRLTIGSHDYTHMQKQL
ncbi:GNAT family N-acetyltransferase [Leuconostoc kimchii]|uniref:GNAT family N-acetyltransferase n=1 Tax=Leuconostoc kimchii TaxID=136609 RepID=A0ABX5SM05_9LACO|nr:GNAT family N-acetyltransferase [Leuconostoc kimchii]QBR47459.1 GNAT family N-acetyltransferase [Leuconostoc kimchii]